VAFTGFTVGHDLDAWQFNDFIIEAAGFLGCCSATLGFQCVVILLIPSDVVALGDNFGGLQHRHVDVWLVFDQPRISGPVGVLVLILHQRNRLDPTTDSDLHAIGNDLLRGRRDAHQTRGTLPVQRHARHCFRQTRPKCRLAGNVLAR
jgi:hypothetical protein